MKADILDMELNLIEKKKFSVTNGSGRDCIICGVDMSSSVHVDNKKKYILVLGEGPTQELDDTTLTAEKKHSINFTENSKKICLSLHYDGVNSYLFVNGTKIHKAKDSEIAATPLCVGNISNTFSIDNMKKTGLSGYIYDYSANYDAISVNDILDIHKYLMKRMA